MSSKNEPKGGVLYLYGEPGSGKSAYSRKLLKKKWIAATYLYDGGDCASMVRIARAALRDGLYVVFEAQMSPPKELQPFCTEICHCKVEKPGQIYIRKMDI